MPAVPELFDRLPAANNAGLGIVPEPVAVPVSRSKPVSSVGVLLYVWMDRLAPYVFCCCKACGKLHSYKGETWRSSLSQVCSNDWVRSTINFLVGPQELTSSGTCQETETRTVRTPSFRAPWRVGDAVVGREDAGRATSESGHPCPCQNCLQRPPAEKTGRGSLQCRP